jgi:UDP-2,3-diacylglucosamine hydrolase
MSLPFYIASDIHLGAVPAQTERRFVRFLEHAGSHASELLLPGDVFDFWFEYGEVIPGKHVRVLGALAALTDAGMRVTMVGGNHDAWGGRFLREELGVDFRTGLVRMQIAGHPALVAHGDGLGVGDLRYRILKRTIRSRAVIGVFRAIHPEVGIRIARAVSRTETREPETVESRGRARFLSDWASQQLSADPALRYVVCGHAHHPSLEEVRPGVWYVNSGDWIHHYTYVTIGEDGVPQMRNWEG